MACPTGKHRFRDRVDASLALLRAARSKNPRRRETRTYQCHQCRGWHLTSQPQPARRKANPQ